MCTGLVIHLKFRTDLSSCPHNRLKAQLSQIVLNDVTLTTCEVLVK